MEQQQVTVFSAVNGWAEAASKDMRFKLWTSADKTQKRIYVEWLHTVGVKHPRWESIGWIDGKTRAIHNGNGANIQGMLEQRGITLRQIAYALTGK